MNTWKSWHRLLAAFAAMMMLFTSVGGDVHFHAHAEETAACTHQNVDTSYFVTDPEMHRRTCLDCGDLVNEETHTLVEGVCSVCAYVCPHMGTSDFEHDENNHWQNCLACGLVFTFAHYDDCRNPGVCVVCGEACEAKGAHFFSGEWVQEETGHWIPCAYCGVASPVESHTSNAQCMVCGRSCDHVNVDTSYFVTDPEMHRRTCLDCGDLVNEETHTIVNGVCSVCGNPCQHAKMDWNTYQSEGDMHWLECPECGEIYNHSTHSASCIAPGVCCYCGVAYTGDSVEHNGAYGNPEMRYDEQYHWRYCTDCQQDVFKNEHWNTCDSRDACHECGIAFTSEDVAHNVPDWNVTEHDETQHWRICSKCGEKAFPTNHWYNNGACPECGYACPHANLDAGVWYYNDAQHWYNCPDCNMELEVAAHTFVDGTCSVCGNPCWHTNMDWTAYESNETHHWLNCPDCGRKVNENEHMGSCTNREVCTSCGAASTQAAHNSIDWENWITTDTHHWVVCLDCNEQINYDTHNVSCQQEGICVTCGITCDAEVNYHPEADYSTYLYDETQHWRACAACNGKAYAHNHWYNNGVCPECGYACTHVNAENAAWLWDSNQHYKQCPDCYQLTDQANHAIVDGACSVCGQACQHPNMDWNTYKSDDGMHWLECPDCGENINRFNHGYYNGVCTTCSYVCSHANMADAWSWDASRHYKWCPDCNVEVEAANHTIVDGACTVCGQPCPHGNRTRNYDENYHWYECAACGMEVDKFEHSVMCGETTCDSCGVTVDPQSFQNFHWLNEGTYFTSDETYHWYVYDCCGATSEKQMHEVDCSTNACIWCRAAGVTGTMYHVDLSYDSAHLASDEECHWYVCLGCGESANFRVTHAAGCTAPGVCDTCGAEYTGENVTHTGIESWQSDESGHWRMCSACNTLESEGEHTTYCTDPGLCWLCGAAYSGPNYSHPNMAWNSWNYDETNHWQECPDCKAQFNLQAHWVYCSDTDTCTICGADCTADEYEHHVSLQYGTWLSDETQHWMACGHCGEVFYLGDHSASCIAPGVCYRCGVAYSGNSVEHNGAYGTPEMQYDVQYHWRYCTDCQQDVFKNEHWNTCDSRDACPECGIAFTSEEVSHYVPDWNVTEHDETQHWRICSKCDEKVSPSNHWYNNGVCPGCGYACPHANMADVAWSKNASQHYKQCPDCRQQTELATHTIVDGACSVCGNPCQHPNMDWYTYKTDDIFHWLECPDCGEKINYFEHYPYCTDPDACGECGMAVSMDWYSHGNVDWDNYQIEGDYHWTMCLDCGEQVAYNPHYGTCTNPDVCVECGVACTTSEIMHADVDWGNYEYDENRHWIACNACGELAEDSEHHVSCTTPNTCNGCGATCTTENVYHPGLNWDNVESDATHHWVECTLCGEKADYYEHVGTCVDPTICGTCGTTFAGNSYYHSGVDWMKYQYDENKHWLYCDDCDELVTNEEHRASCDAPGKCYACGQPYAGDLLMHVVNNWDDWTGDETGHWHICIHCGEKTNEGEHWAFCATPNICVQCGEISESGTWNISHRTEIGADGKPVIHSDEVRHWQKCADCGETIYSSYHAASCTEPGTCYECGVAYTGQRVTHRSENDTYQTSATQHWRICADCEEVIYREEHYAFCAATGKCAQCGAATDTVEHHYDRDAVFSDAEGHWYICRDCGAASEKAEHSALCNAPTVCEDCGVACSGTEVYHEADFEMIQSNETEHWYQCPLCQEEVYHGNHWTFCTDSGACSECGRAGTYEAYHDIYGEYDWVITDAEHWVICPECGEKAYQDVHWASCTDPDACNQCGAATPGLVCHTWDGDTTTLVITHETHAFVCEECGETIVEAHIIIENGACVYGCDIPEEHTHEWTLSTTTAATCTEAGLNTYACTCGETRTESIPANGHNPGAAVTCTTAQTCTVCKAELAPAKGHTAGAAVTCTTAQTCTVCKAELAPAKGHTAGAAATCTTAQTCTVCNAELAPATGHTAGAVATCTTAQTCTVCKAELAPATGHTAGAVATCTTAQICTVCNAELAPATGHTAGAVATCTTAQTCTVCNAELAPATGHTAGAAATCTTAQTCTVCKAELAPATGHTAGAAATCTTAQTCMVCKAELAPATGHTAGAAATCTTAQTCTVCNAELAAALGHTYVDTVIASWCTVNGYTRHDCACGDSYRDTYVPAPGHNYKESSRTPATCTEDGVINYSCFCGWTKKEAIPATGHSYTATVVAPTCTKVGYTLNACACGDSYKTDEVAALGHTLEEVERTDATCQVEGVSHVACACGYEEDQVIPVANHYYGAKYTYLSDGRHVSYCVYGCGAQRVRNCQTNTISVGLMKYDVCAICGNMTAQQPAAIPMAAPTATPTATPTPKPGETAAPTVDPTATPEPTPAPTPVIITTVVENAVVEFAKPAESKAPAASKDGGTPAETIEAEAPVLSLVVHQQVMLLPAAKPTATPASTSAEPAADSTAAPEGVETPESTEAPEATEPAEELEVAVRIFNLALVDENGEEQQLAGKANIRIPFEEEKTDLRLVMLMPDGTQVEIEYEIIDGMLVFETEMLGTFALLPPEEEETL